MAERVRVRRLTPEEGQRLQRIVRRGEPKQAKSVIRWRRATMILASAGGNPVPTIAKLVAADEDTVREVIHRFNETGLACLDPNWAGGRPRLLSTGDEDFVAATAATRPRKLGRPFTRWSIRKLADYLAEHPSCPIRVGREVLRTLMRRRGITFQRTKTWKESTDPDFDAKLDRIEHVLQRSPDRTFAFDEFGPLGIRPVDGVCWAGSGRPDRVPATYRRTQGVTYFHGCYSIGDDTLWGINHRKKGTGNTLKALTSIRAARPDGQPISIILDNLSAHTDAQIRRWAARNNVELCFTPTYASWANPTRRTSGRCVSSPWPTRTTPTTSCRPASCTATYAGATSMPATPTCWPRNAANAPAFAARKDTDGADHEQHDQTPQTITVTALAGLTRPPLVP